MWKLEDAWQNAKFDYYGIFFCLKIMDVAEFSTTLHHEEAQFMVCSPERQAEKSFKKLF